MSNKKLSIFFAASLLAVSSLAFSCAPGDENCGMPELREHASSTEDESVFNWNFYFDVHAGYSFANWNTMVGTMTTIWAFQGGMKKNQQGGLMGGLDLGLQITDDISWELGGYYLPTIKGIINGQTISPGNACGDEGCVEGTQYNWMTYTAAKISVPVPYLSGLDLFGKVGTVLRFMSNSHQTVLNRGGVKKYLAVIYGAGFDYEFVDSNCNVGIQWLHIPPNYDGQERDNSVASQSPKNSGKLATRQPTANLLSLSFGYTFGS